MSGGSGTNSWTILPPEETVAETLSPLAEGIEHHEESLPSETVSEENQPSGGAKSAEELPVEGQQVSEETTAKLCKDSTTEQDASVPAAITDTPVPTSSEVSGNDAFSQSEGPPKGVSQCDPDSFSDSRTHIAPSSDAPPATLLSTETLGGVEFTQEEEESLTQEGRLHPLNGEGQEGEEPDLSQRIPDVGKQSEVGELRTEGTGEEGEPEVRRRRSLLKALERIGRTEEEEEVDEAFRLPQQEEDSGFSLNKCILGAVILLVLGAILFSGALLDLDEESDYSSRELRDAESPGTQEWLNPEGSPPPVDADKAELLNKLAQGNQHISILQAQLQAQTEELNGAKAEAAKGAKECLRWEEVEKENRRLKEEVASLPVLQKANERMKRELESVPALQRELETLRSSGPDLKLPSDAGAAREAVQAPVNLTAPPSSGQLEDRMKGTAEFTEKQPRKPWNDQTEGGKDVVKDKDGIKEKGGKRSEWKEGEKNGLKEEGRSEWKKGKREKGEFVKEIEKEGKQKWHSDETKQWKVEDWKKITARGGDQGKSWKDRQGKREWKEKSDGKEWTGDKDATREKVDEGKGWRSEEDKRAWKVRKEHGDERKEWKKGKDGKDKWEKKDWKEKEEKKDWKKDGIDNSKEGKWKGERKRWSESEWKSRSGNHEGDWEGKGWGKKEEQLKKGGQKERNGWMKGKTSSRKYTEHKSTSDRGHEGEPLWGGREPLHTHRRAAVEQPEYWIHQRERFQLNPNPPQQCPSLESCARAEGLLPVALPDFQAILQTYLAKAEEAGADASTRGELRKVAHEFFKDGVFAHDRTSFRGFVEDVGDVLEDMVEGEEEIEEEMEGFEREVMGRFSAPGAAVKEKVSTGEWRKESVDPIRPKSAMLNLF